MGAIKAVCTEIEEAIEGGAEAWEAVTDAIVRWEIDPASDFARQLENLYIQGQDDTAYIPPSELH